MYQIKLSESTATLRRIPILLVDATDGYTPKTGQTGVSVLISKNGGTPASTANSVVEIGNGQYYIELTAVEVNTLGWIAVNVQKTACRQYNAIIQVMAYDYAAGSNLGLTNLDALITSRMATFTYTAPPTTTDIWSAITRTLTSGAAPSATTIADAVLNRKLDSTGDGTDTTDERTVRSALRAMRNKVVVNSGAITVYKEDDATQAWTGTLSNTADVTVNPTGGSL
jgi:hypothetical protein